jgi:hypothetical protein
MDAARQRAYRFLLYHALLEIRMLGWRASPRSVLNPFALRRARPRRLLGREPARASLPSPPSSPQPPEALGL